MTKEERKAKFEKIRPYIQVGVTTFVELFTNAASTAIMSKTNANKFTKIGAKIGGDLVGLKIGADVSDYICDSIDEFLDNLDEFKEAIDEAKEEQ